MIKTSVSIEEFRVNLADLVGRVMYGNSRVIVKKYNRDAAVLLSIEDYEKLADPAKRFSKKQWQNKFALIDKIKKRISTKEQDALTLAIADAVSQIRAARKNGE